MKFKTNNKVLWKWIVGIFLIPVVFMPDKGTPFVPKRYAKSTVSSSVFTYQYGSFYSPSMELVPNEPMTFSFEQDLNLSKGDLLVFNCDMDPYLLVNVGYLFEDQVTTESARLESGKKQQFQLPYDGQYWITVENHSSDPVSYKEGAIQVQIKRYEDIQKKKQTYYQKECLHALHIYERVGANANVLLNPLELSALSVNHCLNFFVSTAATSQLRTFPCNYVWQGGRLEPKESMAFCYPYDTGNGVELLSRQPIIIQYHLDRKTEHILRVVTPMGYYDYPFHKKDNSFIYYAHEPFTTIYSFQIINTSATPTTPFYISDFSIQY